MTSDELEKVRAAVADWRDRLVRDLNYAAPEIRDEFLQHRLAGAVDHIMRRVAE